jgi:type II secretory pathway pseudopilin PulG
MKLRHLVNLSMDTCWTRNFRDNRAFSLVEALIATLVLAISFVSLFAAFSTGFAAVEVSRENLRATQVLLEKLETIRLYSWTQINQSGFIPSTFSAPFNPSTNATGGFTFNGTVTITNSPVSEAYSDDLKLVTVQVNWTSARIARKAAMSTLVSRYGLQNYIYY